MVYQLCYMAYGGEETGSLATVREPSTEEV